jgi:hypothetical protein
VVETSGVAEFPDDVPTLTNHHRACFLVRHAGAAGALVRPCSFRVPLRSNPDPGESGRGLSSMRLDGRCPAHVCSLQRCMHALARPDVHVSSVSLSSPVLPPLLLRISQPITLISQNPLSPRLPACHMPAAVKTWQRRRVCSFSINTATEVTKQLQITAKYRY